LARSWEIQPTEFWDMTMPEFFAEMDMRRKDVEGGYAGRLTRGDLDDLKEWMHNGATTA